VSKQIKRTVSFTRDTRLDEEVQLWLSPELPKASDRAIDAQTASYNAQEQMTLSGSSLKTMIFASWPPSSTTE
jgi:hypothetical protein